MSRTYRYQNGQWIDAHDDAPVDRLFDGTPGGERDALAVLTGVDAGEYEHVTGAGGGRRWIYIRTAIGISRGIETAAGTNIFRVPIGSWHEIEVAAAGPGTPGICDELKRRHMLRLELEREADDDPEGAFGGRGNNVLL